MTHDQETAQNIWRDAILEAMDAAAKRITGQDNVLGADDADLPRLFKALDLQMNVALERAGHHLWAGWVGSEKYMNERASLIAHGAQVCDDEALR